ncbi:MAG: penicillin-binding protein activator [Rhodospirillales bacterium]|nr:MAG: penicillin-binding protein activator [Rhodospirillales bacterium]
MRTLFFALLALVVLAGCETGMDHRAPVIGTADGRPQSEQAQTSSPFPSSESMINGANTVMGGAQPPLVQQGGAVVAGNFAEPVRVAILVPQSGSNAAMGQALLQAAQLAVFDLNEPNFQLIPKDTMGTPEGARMAVDQAARDGARLILGPLFSQEVTAAKDAARAYGLTVIGFSTDWRTAGGNVYSMGVLPFEQAQRIARYAAQQGLKRVGVIAPRDMYGDAVLSVFQTEAARAGITVVKTVRIAADGSDAPQGVQQLTGGQAMISGRLPYDAIFMPVGAPVVLTLASALRQYGLGANAVRYLGTGLWDDPAVTRDPTMNGAIYAAPSPQLRATFERNYQHIYGQTPPRLASIGYDAAALAVVLARNAAQSGQRVSYDQAALTNPNGFSGVDGIFRFGPNGLADRGMAVLQINNGTVRVVEPAPNTFQ